jgi:K+-transporting ATPase ATPase C chain
VFRRYRDQLKPALTLFGLLTLLTGVVYPLLVTGIAQVLFPSLAIGSLIVHDGIPVGSGLIGQQFHQPGYFWGRPSATSPPYNASASAGSNLGPSNPALVEAVRRREEHLRFANPGNRTVVPPDLLTSSGSGLDPHISPEAALYQVPRVARARGVSEERLRRLVAQYTEDRQFGLLGEPRVNVLELNLALDRMLGVRGLARRANDGDGTIIRSGGPISSAHH